MQSKTHRSVFNCERSLKPQEYDAHIHCTSQMRVSTKHTETTNTQATIDRHTHTDTQTYNS